LGSLDQNVLKYAVLQLGLPDSKAADKAHGRYRRTGRPSSLGAAEAHVAKVDVDDSIQQADAALNRAKEAGRDRLVAAPRVEVGTGGRSPPLAKAS
jgi:hypothetical protein